MKHLGFVEISCRSVQWANSIGINTLCEKGLWYIFQRVGGGYLRVLVLSIKLVGSAMLQIQTAIILGLMKDGSLLTHSLASQLQKPLSKWGQRFVNNSFLSRSSKFCVATATVTWKSLNVKCAVS